MAALTDIDVESIASWANLARMTAASGSQTQRIFTPLVDQAIRGMNIGALSELGQAIFMRIVGVDEEVPGAKEILDVLDIFVASGVFVFEADHEWAEELNTLQAAVAAVAPEDEDD